MTWKAPQLDYLINTYNRAHCQITVAVIDTGLALLQPPNTHHAHCWHDQQLPAHLDTSNRYDGYEHHGRNPQVKCNGDAC